MIVKDEAKKKFVDLLRGHEKGTNIRVFVEHPGTPDAECGIAFCPPSLYDMADLVYEFDDFKVIIDPISDPYLQDAVIGVNEKDTFTLKSPSITKDFLEPSLPLIERIKFVVATEVNPGIATHGGAVEVISLSDENVLSVRFHGGCVGCAAVGSTIKDSLQVKLNQRFREDKITISDVTEHKVTDGTFQS